MGRVFPWVTQTVYVVARHSQLSSSGCTFVIDSVSTFCSLCVYRSRGVVIWGEDHSSPSSWNTLTRCLPGTSPSISSLPTGFKSTSCVHCGSVHDLSVLNVYTFSVTGLLFCWFCCKHMLQILYVVFDTCVCVCACALHVSAVCLWVLWSDYFLLCVVGNRATTWVMRWDNSWTRVWRSLRDWNQSPLPRLWKLSSSKCESEDRNNLKDS